MEKVIRTEKLTFTYSADERKIEKLNKKRRQVKKETARRLLPIREKVGTEQEKGVLLNREEKIAVSNAPKEPKREKENDRRRRFRRRKPLFFACRRGCSFRFIPFHRSSFLVFVIFSALTGSPIFPIFRRLDASSATRRSANLRSRNALRYYLTSFSAKSAVLFSPRRAVESGQKSRKIVKIITRRVDEKYNSRIEVGRETGANAASFVILAPDASRNKRRVFARREIRRPPRSRRRVFPFFPILTNRRSFDDRPARRSIDSRSLLDSSDGPVSVPPL